MEANRKYVVYLIKKSNNNNINIQQNERVKEKQNKINVYIVYPLSM